MHNRFTCPCCGHKTIARSFQPCDICGWEYNAYQNQHVDDACGPNFVPLRQAQKNYRAFGAISPDYMNVVRPPRPQDVRDQSWHPIEPLLQPAQASARGSGH